MTETNDRFDIGLAATVIAKPDNVYTLGRRKHATEGASIRCIPINELLYAYVTQNFPLSQLGDKCAAHACGEYPFPFANPEFAEFLPSPVENYWYTRFRGVHMVQTSNDSFSQFKLLWMAYPNENCSCLNDTSIPENLFSDDVRKDWNSFGAGLRVIASRFQVQQKTQHIVFEREKPFLIILHDAHYHPLCLMELLNELNKKFNVILPYMHDLANLSSSYVRDKLIYAMADKIGDVLDLLVDNYVEDFKRQFSMLAHGAACSLAVYISDRFKCERLTLLNPMGNILAKPRCESSPSAQDAKQFYNKSPENSISAYSDAGVLTGVLPSQADSTPEEEIPKITPAQHRKSSIRLSIAKRPSCTASMIGELAVNMQEIAAQAVNDLALDEESERDTLPPPVPMKAASSIPRSVALQKKKFSFQSAVLSNQNLVQQRRISNRLGVVSEESESYIGGVFELINDQITQIYSDSVVMHGLLHAAGINHSTDMRRCTTLRQLSTWGVGRSQANFMRMLPSLCLFCNLRVIDTYRRNIKHLDKRFFAAIGTICTTLAEPIPLGREKTTILLSSHGCFLTRDTLANIAQIDEKYDYIQCRTVLGAGHDLFDIAIELLVGILTM